MENQEIKQSENVEIEKSATQKEISTNNIDNVYKELRDIKKQNKELKQEVEWGNFQKNVSFDNEEEEKEYKEIFLKSKLNSQDFFKLISKTNTKKPEQKQNNLEELLKNFNEAVTKTVKSEKTKERKMPAGIIK